MGRVRGFTLPELMVAVALVAITLVWGIPSMQETIERNKLATAVNDFAAVLALARSEAVTRGSRVSICPSTSGTTCSTDWTGRIIVFVDADGTCTGGTALRETYPISPSTAAVALATDPPTSLTCLGFLPLGMTAAGTGLRQASDDVNISICNASLRANKGRVLRLPLTGHHSLSAAEC